MAYDARCYELALWFLTDEPGKNHVANRKALAQYIQDQIEEWIAFDAEVISDDEKRDSAT